MTPAEHRTLTIARFRHDACQRFVGVALDRLNDEIDALERVWSTLDQEPRTGKGVGHEEKQAALRLGCIRSSLRRLHPQEEVAEVARQAVERQAVRQAVTERLQAERRARAPIQPPVRVAEPAAPAPAQMSLFGD